MYPVLTVEGKELRIGSIDFSEDGSVRGVGVFESLNYTYYYNENHPAYVEGKLKVDMKTSLKWVDRYKEVLEDIEMVIEEKYDLMTTISHEEMRRRKELPFSDNKNEQQYFNKEREMIGLHHAKEIIEKFVD